MDVDTPEGLRRERSNPDWPYPYAPQYGLPAFWRGIALTDKEWRALTASTPHDMMVWEDRPGATWADTLSYWTSRAATQADVMEIVDTELFDASEGDTA